MRVGDNQKSTPLFFCRVESNLEFRNLEDSLLKLGFFWNGQAKDVVLDPLMSLVIDRYVKFYLISKSNQYNLGLMLNVGTSQMLEALKRARLTEFSLKVLMDSAKDCSTVEWFYWHLADCLGKRGDDKQQQEKQKDFEFKQIGSKTPVDENLLHSQITTRSSRWPDRQLINMKKTLRDGKKESDNFLNSLRAERKKGKAALLINETIQIKTKKIDYGKKVFISDF